MKRETLFDNTRDENGNFQTGYRVTKTMKRITVDYVTNIQGDCDKQWLVPIADWEAIEGDPQRRCMVIENSCSPTSVGSPIE